MLRNVTGSNGYPCRHPHRSLGGRACPAQGKSNCRYEFSGLLPLRRTPGQVAVDAARSRFYDQLVRDELARQVDRGPRRSAACCASTAARPRTPTTTTGAPAAPGRVLERRRSQACGRARGWHRGRRAVERVIRPPGRERPFSSSTSGPKSRALLFCLVAIMDWHSRHSLLGCNFQRYVRCQFSR
jgi:hypothetical protein